MTEKELCIPGIATPYYVYDRITLERTLDEIVACRGDIAVHYAVKANDNPDVLRLISSYGLGADCVSGGEVAKVLANGFPASGTVLAGVGKRDDEIELALRNGIYCLNAESEEELAVINQIADEMGVMASVAIRINPNIDAHTHANITTGTEENKFGIPIGSVDETLSFINSCKSLKFKGLHFHIGSQITEYNCFSLLCATINRLVGELASHGVMCEIVDVGGGLGVDYENPSKNLIPDFRGYFNVWRNGLNLPAGTKVHCELGRSVVAQCGHLITRVLFTKHTANRKFVIVDAGFTDLVRPALYDAWHDIENISASENANREKCDIVGPICESSDVFAKDREIAAARRGDLLAIHSAGAYGEVMASQYNARPLIKGYLK